LVFGIWYLEFGTWNLELGILKIRIMYIEPIIWMLSWPVLIVVSYQLIKLAIKKFESKIEQK